MRFRDDPYGFIPKCIHCDDAGCDRCCPTEPVTLQDLERLDNDYGPPDLSVCPVCGGDCASANPPVIFCPMQRGRT